MEDGQELKMQYLASIYDLLTKCNDLEMLDLILRILKKNVLRD